MSRTHSGHSLNYKCIEQWFEWSDLWCSVQWQTPGRASATVSRCSCLREATPRVMAWGREGDYPVKGFVKAVDCAVIGQKNFQFGWILLKYGFFCKGNKNVTLFSAPFFHLPLKYKIFFKYTCIRCIIVIRIERQYELPQCKKCDQVCENPAKVIFCDCWFPL